MLAVDIARTIDIAAGLLNAVGRADTSAGVSLHCLLAVEHLRVAGEDPSSSAGIAGDTVEDVIRTALRHLATLPLDVFARTDILTAASAARTALARAEDA
jgi:hypothetical protein